MMGTQNNQPSLFSYQINLEQRVRPDHPLRKVKEVVDFSFVRAEVAALYGYNGNESVAPEVILKMMFLLFYDNVASERELMRIIGERLDYLWFLGYELDEKIPDHSVLSKARARWGREAFEKFFVHSVGQCVAAGLVDGKKIHVDSSLNDANASCDSVLKAAPELIAALKAAYAATESKLEDATTPDSYEAVNDRVVSTTDPDAAVVRRGQQPPRPRYQNHRVIDDAQGVITAVETTPGSIAENNPESFRGDQPARNQHRPKDRGRRRGSQVRHDGELRCLRPTRHPHPPRRHARQATPRPQPGNLSRQCVPLRRAHQHLSLSGRPDDETAAAAPDQTHLGILLAQGRLRRLPAAGAMHPRFLRTHDSPPRTPRLVGSSPRASPQPGRSTGSKAPATPRGGQLCRRGQPPRLQTGAVAPAVAGGDSRLADRRHPKHQDPAQEHPPAGRGGRCGGKSCGIAPRDRNRSRSLESQPPCLGSAGCSGVVSEQLRVAEAIELMEHKIRVERELWATAP